MIAVVDLPDPAPKDIGFTIDGNHAEKLGEPRPHRIRGARYIDRYIPSDEHMTDAIRQATNGAGANVVFDAVGGITFEPALESLAHRGRLVVISTVGRSRVEFDVRDFYHNESRIVGADSRKLDASASAR